jgi:hypothetical protein
MNLTIRRVEHVEIEEVLDVLVECSSWLMTRGIVLRPDRSPESVRLPGLDRGDRRVVTDYESPVATVTLGLQVVVRSIGLEARLFTTSVACRPLPD